MKTKVVISCAGTTQLVCAFVFLYASISLSHDAALMMRRHGITNRHFQLNPILILEFEIGVRIFVLMDIIKDNM